MAKSKIEVDINLTGKESVAETEKKVLGLRDELKLLKALMRDGVFEGDEFEQVAKRAGEVQDKIADVNQRVKNLASDSKQLDGFINITQGIVGGFAAVQGITALVGDENEELTKTMVKLQAAMSALSGIQAIQNALQAESSAMLAINAVKTTALAAATTLYTYATGGATVATNVFRTALIATGIGAIIVLLVTLAQKMDLFGDSVAETTEKIKAMQEAQDKLNEKFKEGDNELIERYAQERDIAKAKLKLAGATNDQLIEEDKKFLLKKKGLLQLEVTDQTLSAEQRRKAQNEVNKIDNELLLKQLEKQEAIKEQHDKKTKEKKADKKDDPTGLKNANKDEDDFAKFLMKRGEEEEKIKHDQREAEAEAEKKHQDELTRLAKEADQERIKSYLDSVRAKESIAKDSFSILNDLAYLALGEQYKQTALGKTLALAQIATDTALAISALVRNSEGNPLNAATGGIAGISQFVAGIARITANIAKAKSILSSGGGSAAPGGGGNAQSQSSAPPSLQGFTPDVNKNKNSKDNRVYVVETDITKTQKRVARIQDNAELI